MREKRCMEQRRNEMARETIPTCENSGTTPPGIEPGSPKWDGPPWKPRVQGQEARDRYGRHLTHTPSASSLLRAGRFSVCDICYLHAPESRLTLSKVARLLLTELACGKSGIRFPVVASKEEPFQKPRKAEIRRAGPGFEPRFSQTRVQKLTTTSFRSLVRRHVGLAVVSSLFAICEAVSCYPAIVFRDPVPGCDPPFGKRWSIGRLSVGEKCAVGESPWPHPADLPRPVSETVLPRGPGYSQIASPPGVEMEAGDSARGKVALCLPVRLRARRNCGPQVCNFSPRASVCGRAIVPGVGSAVGSALIAQGQSGRLDVGLSGVRAPVAPRKISNSPVVLHVHSEFVIRELNSCLIGNRKLLRGSIPKTERGSVVVTYWTRIREDRDHPDFGFPAVFPKSLQRPRHTLYLYVGIGEFREFTDKLAVLHCPVYTRASDVCSLARESSQCPSLHTWHYDTRYLFDCKSAIGLESSRACLMSCDPFVKKSVLVSPVSLPRFLTLEAQLYPTLRRSALEWELLDTRQTQGRCPVQCVNMSRRVITTFDLTGIVSLHQQTLSVREIDRLIVLRRNEGAEGQREIPEKIRLPAAWSGDISVVGGNLKISSRGSEVTVEQRRNARLGEAGDPRENPPTSIIWHDSHKQKSVSDPVGDRTRFAWVVILRAEEGEAWSSGMQRRGKQEIPVRHDSHMRKSGSDPVGYRGPVTTVNRLASGEYTTAVGQPNRVYTIPRVCYILLTWDQQLDRTASSVSLTLFALCIPAARRCLHSVRCAALRSSCRPLGAGRSGSSSEQTSRGARSRDPPHPRSPGSFRGGDFDRPQSSLADSRILVPCRPYLDRASGPQTRKRRCCKWREPNIEVLRADEGEVRRSPRKPVGQAASAGVIPTCENPKSELPPPPQLPPTVEEGEWSNRYTTATPPRSKQPDVVNDDNDDTNNHHRPPGLAHHRPPSERSRLGSVYPHQSPPAAVTANVMTWNTPAPLLADSIKIPPPQCSQRGERKRLGWKTDGALSWAGEQKSFPLAKLFRNSPGDGNMSYEKSSHSRVGLLASHQGEPGSISGRVTPGFLHVGVVPDDASGRRVISGIPRSPPMHSGIPALLHFHLISPSSALKISSFRATQISQLNSTLFCPFIELCFVVPLACPGLTQIRQVGNSIPIDFALLMGFPDSWDTWHPGGELRATAVIFDDVTLKPPALALLVSSGHLGFPLVPFWNFPFSPPALSFHLGSSCSCIPILFSPTLSLRCYFF
ncbi:hypothetical protein PR048_019378 [Dryococelus australis]|uniref:Uncharacterized protein n=1 Tax=Dryococelus australis TaxID=614101 RepID=A0ABQ9H3C5_9NEOP|nr:hypothetical protein PR048_019378 [Dryococelus australis]